ncbi:MAG: hypothetical protein R3F43_24040 [bacterium]
MLRALPLLILAAPLACGSPPIAPAPPGSTSCTRSTSAACPVRWWGSASTAWGPASPTCWRASRRRRTSCLRCGPPSSSRRGSWTSPTPARACWRRTRGRAARWRRLRRRGSPPPGAAARASPRRRARWPTGWPSGSWWRRCAPLLAGGGAPDPLALGRAADAERPLVLWSVYGEGRTPADLASAVIPGWRGADRGPARSQAGCPAVELVRCWPGRSRSAT